MCVCKRHGVCVCVCRGMALCVCVEVYPRKCDGVHCCEDTASVELLYIN